MAQFTMEDAAEFLGLPCECGCELELEELVIYAALSRGTKPKYAAKACRERVHTRRKRAKKRRAIAEGALS